MAVTTAGNVWKMAANADVIAGPTRFEGGVKVVAGAAGCTINIRKENVSGVVMFSKVLGANAEIFEKLPLISAKGLYLEIAAGAATVFLHSK